MKRCLYDTCCYRYDDHVKHVKMRNIDGKYDVGGGPSFVSISKLIDFYGQNPMVEENAGTVLHLKQVNI